MNSQASASWLKIKLAKPVEITKRVFIEKYIEEYDHTYESDYYGFICWQVAENQSFNLYAILKIDSNNI